jgi:hypothetical protein
MFLRQSKSKQNGSKFAILELLEFFWSIYDLSHFLAPSAQLHNESLKMTKFPIKVKHLEANKVKARVADLGSGLTREFLPISGSEISNLIRSGRRHKNFVFKPQVSL